MIITLLTGFGLYLFTMCPTVYSGDSGELPRAQGGYAIHQPAGQPRRDREHGRSRKDAIQRRSEGLQFCRAGVPVERHSRMVRIQGKDIFQGNKRRR